VGSWAARILHQSGCRIIALSDVEGGIYNPRGLAVSQIAEYKSAGISVSQYPDGEKVTNEELLELECDVLIPAAIDNVITAENAPRIKAGLIVEAANHPVTFQGDQVLIDRGITVLPDILANAGGVTVSYFEWTQNLQEFRWEEERVNQELRKVMSRAYRSVHEKVALQGLNYRQAAFDIGVGRVARAVNLRGFV
jgi:glutamate dehydrogenase (NAD(P)+)